MHATYYAAEVAPHKVTLFADVGSGYFPMYGPFDIRYHYESEDLEHRVESLEKWGYRRVERPPTAPPHRKHTS